MPVQIADLCRRSIGGFSAEVHAQLLRCHSLVVVFLLSWLVSRLVVESWPIAQRNAKDASILENSLLKSVGWSVVGPPRFLNVPGRLLLLTY
eukprot:COSAG05_NODE_4959_length_1309_cov_13.218750_2_plen_92_part_00